MDGHHGLTGVRAQNHVGKVRHNGAGSAITLFQTNLANNAKGMQQMLARAS